jgi:TRAP-type mannitol/chloroaromatic compound transport system permease small subunit
VGVLLAVSDALDRVLRAIAGWAVWLMPALAAVICIDVVTRKFGLFLPVLTSSRLQELQWHLHTVLFAVWLGFAYVVNGHPRVDSLTGELALRRRAWLELAGCVMFAVPYCYLLVRYGVPFAWNAWRTGEGPATVGGIPQPWIIKGLFAAGLVLLFIAVLSMTLRLTVFLFGGRHAGSARLPLDGPSASI